MQSFADIKRIVKAINEYPHDAFRYPTDLGGSKELLSGGVRFDVLIFDEKVNSLLCLLDSAATGTRDAFESDVRQPKSLEKL